MAWVRIDDEMYQHPSIMQAGALAFAMQVAGLCYCNRYLTDGFIPASVVPVLVNLGNYATWQEVVASLIEHKIWEEVDGGYAIRNYLKYQPSREKVLAKRAKRSAAGRRGGLASAQARARASAKQEASKSLSKTSSKNERSLNPNPNPNYIDDDDRLAHEKVKAMLSDIAQFQHWVPHVVTLNDYADELGWPVVLEAMNRTLEYSRDRSWMYAKRILDSWSARGAKSLDDIKVIDAEHEVRKQVRSDKRSQEKPNSSPAFEPIFAPEGYGQ